MYEIIYNEELKNEKLEDITKKVLEVCFKEENIENSTFYITVTFCSPNYIKEINKEYRSIDKQTDVLSFPMFEKEELDNMIKNNKFNLEIEEILGDIIINIKQVEIQAKEYNHSFEREFCYMLVHGFYHLMGYDHIDNNDKKIMRCKEEKILSDLDVIR